MGSVTTVRPGPNRFNQKPLNNACSANVTTEVPA